MAETKKSITMKDVALEAGVSVGTVSRVINKEKGIKEVTLKKVENAIKRLNYIPDNYARGMKKNRTETIALVIPSIWHPFFSEFAMHVEKALVKYHYKLFICNADGDVENEVDYINMLQRNKVDGIIGITYSDVDKYITSDLPFVSVDRHFTEDVCYVTSDNYKGGRLAADEFVKRGGKHLAFVGAVNVHENDTLQRGEGFRDRARELGVKVENLEMIEPLVEPDKQIEKFLKLHPEIDSIFAVNDMMALRVRKNMSNLGNSTPEDYQLIGFDGLKNADDQEYFLSTIVQDIKGMAEASVELLKKLIDEKNIDSKRIVLPVHFFEHETTKKIQ